MNVNHIPGVNGTPPQQFNFLALPLGGGGAANMLSMVSPTSIMAPPRANISSTGMAAPPQQPHVNGAALLRRFGEEDPAVMNFATRLVRSMRELSIPIEGTGAYLNRIIQLIPGNPEAVESAYQYAVLVSENLLEDVSESDAVDFAIPGGADALVLQSFFNSNDMNAADRARFATEINNVIQSPRFKSQLGNAILTQLRAGNAANINQQRIDSVTQWNKANENESYSRLLAFSGALFC